ncbi:MAG TPA: AMP-binding protein [Candidatus Fimenecus excrementigallinarum]|uniref:AMP-binding protein n=1 Tax=Candidatus Fimenecus excrementigallinarum TaxID=2840816 RepID=A0A9D1LD67_9FIRM|nr:AMP-binding protein [Candidatus Fimenecus excrementigallinarum]
MNIYDAVYQVNQNGLSRRAASIALADGGERVYTYGELFFKADAYAAGLTAAGVRAGDRVALVGASSPEWTAAFLAVCKCRCTAALLDASLGKEALLEFSKDADVRAAFWSDAAAQKLDGVSAAYPVFSMANGAVLPGFNAAVPDTLPPTPDPDETAACLFFSSGTTHKAAGVLHTHDALIRTTRMTLGEQGLCDSDRYLGILPNSHIYGMVCLVLGPALSGAQVHYLETLGAEAVLAAFASYRPTVLPAVPKVYELFYTQILRKIHANPVTSLLYKVFFPICLRRRQKTGSLLGKKVFKSIHEGFGGCLSYVCSAGAPLSGEVADFYYGTGFGLLITYGATETNIPTVGNRPNDIHPDSCGLPYPDIEIRRSGEGELLVRSPYRMLGYFRDEAATKAAFTEDGFFHTGDLCEIDAAGYVRITGRLKENIVLPSGKKVTPEELEAQYAGLADAQAFVICGVERANGDGDEVHAFCVPKADTPECRAALEAEIRAKSAGIHQAMRVAQVHFVEEIPQTSLQKPKRYLLRELALEQRRAAPEKPSPAAEADVLDFVRRAVARVANAAPEEVRRDTRIFAELPVDSLGAVDLALTLEERFGPVPDDKFTPDLTVEGLAALLLAPHDGDRQGDGPAYPFEKTNRDYLAYAFFRNMVRLNYKMHFSGLANLPDSGGYVLCANHVTKLDYLYITAAMPKSRVMRLCCMAKKELFRKDPFSKQLIRSTGMVPVDRSGVNTKSMESLRRKLQAGWGVLIHPEGTRSEDGIFRDMKSGAAVLAVETGVPVVPVYLHGAFAIFPKGRKWFRLFDWKHMRKFPLDVTFGEPIPSAGKTAQQLTAEVRDAILRLQEAARAK